MSTNQTPVSPLDASPSHGCHTGACGCKAAASTTVDRGCCCGDRCDCGDACACPQGCGRECGCGA